MMQLNCPIFKTTKLEAPKIPDGGSTEILSEIELQRLLLTSGLKESNDSLKISSIWFWLLNVLNQIIFVQ